MFLLSKRFTGLAWSCFGITKRQDFRLQWYLVEALENWNGANTFETEGIHHCCSFVNGKFYSLKPVMCLHIDPPDENRGSFISPLIHLGVILFLQREYIPNNDMLYTL